MGRPSKLTPELQELFCEALGRGLPPEAAAASVGIGVSTYYNWKAKGEKAKSGKYREFLEAFKNAEPKGEAALANIVLKAAEKDWKAAMTYLERRWPSRWARRIYKPDDARDSTFVINFTRPPINPEEKGDDLIIGDGSNGKGNGQD